ncbi:hypothetical protein ACOME3_003069 [Neoechinorhynchus agilis]
MAKNVKILNLSRITEADVNGFTFRGIKKSLGSRTSQSKSYEPFIANSKVHNGKQESSENNDLLLNGRRNAGLPDTSTKISERELPSTESEALIIFKKQAKYWDKERDKYEEMISENRMCLDEIRRKQRQRIQRLATEAKMDKPENEEFEKILKGKPKTKQFTIPQLKEHNVKDGVMSPTQRLIFETLESMERGREVMRELNDRLGSEDKSIMSKDDDWCDEFIKNDLVLPKSNDNRPEQEYKDSKNLLTALDFMILDIIKTILQGPTLIEGVRDELNRELKEKELSGRYVAREGTWNRETQESKNDSFNEMPTTDIKSVKISSSGGRSGVISFIRVDHSDLYLFNYLETIVRSGHFMDAIENELKKELKRRRRPYVEPSSKRAVKGDQRRLLSDDNIFEKTDGVESTLWKRELLKKEINKCKGLEQRPTEFMDEMLFGDMKSVANQLKNIVSTDLVNETKDADYFSSLAKNLRVKIDRMKGQRNDCLERQEPSNTTESKVLFDLSKNLSRISTNTNVREGAVGYGNNSNAVTAIPKRKKQRVTVKKSSGQSKMKIPSIKMATPSTVAINNALHFDPTIGTSNVYQRVDFILSVLEKLIKTGRGVKIEKDLSPPFTLLNWWRDRELELRRAMTRILVLDPVVDYDEIECEETEAEIRKRVLAGLDKDEDQRFEDIVRGLDARLKAKDLQGLKTMSFAEENGTLRRKMFNKSTGTIVDFSSPGSRRQSKEQSVVINFHVHELKLNISDLEYFGDRVVDCLKMLFNKTTQLNDRFSNAVRVLQKSILEILNSVEKLKTYRKIVSFTAGDRVQNLSLHGMSKEIVGEMDHVISRHYTNGSIFINLIICLVLNP